MASLPTPPTSVRSDSQTRSRVKVEGSRSVRCGFATPMYAEVPKLGDGGRLLKKDFVEMYGLEYDGLDLKHVKIPKDLTMDEIVSLFGPAVNKNGHNYIFSGEPEIIKRVETLYMIIHQKPCVPASRIIPLKFVKGIACEHLKKKKMNWARYAEWTNGEQQRRMAEKATETISLLSDDEGEDNEDCNDATVG